MVSLWRANTDMPEFPRLDGEATIDVLIIGGGITGILTAYFLHEAGVKYILVEKNRICSGTTENTTGKITYQHGLIYSRLVHEFGSELARMYLCAGMQAADKYAELCRDIKCEYEVRDNYVYSLYDRKKLENEMTALEKIGYKADLCDTLPLPLKTAGAVRFDCQAQFDPLAFLSHIARGLNIYENTFIKDIDAHGAVGDRIRINAERVVVATHFPFIDRRGSYFLKLYQHRSYVIALEGTQDVGGMYVDENNAGLSFRNSNDLLLLGGGGHRTGKRGGGWDELRRFANANCKGAREVYAWATQDCMSLDGMPYIGHYSKHTPRTYTASGFNKWGMTGAMLSATLLSDMLVGKRNEYAGLFSPSRSIIKPQLFVNGIETAKNLLTPTPKRCSHLGCALKYNAAEHSWDCACHGSRFDCQGKVLNNPANKELKK